MASSKCIFDRLLIIGAGSQANAVTDSATLLLATTISFVGERPDNIYQIPNRVVYSSEMPLSPLLGKYNAVLCAIKALRI